MFQMLIWNTWNMQSASAIDSKVRDMRSCGWHLPLQLGCALRFSSLHRLLLSCRRWLPVLPPTGLVWIPSVAPSQLQADKPVPPLSLCPPTTR